MRKVILMTLLVAVSGSAMADWVAIDESSFGKTYVNPGTISKSGDLVKVWELIDLKKSQEHDGESFFSLTSEVEYDCVRKSFQVLKTAGISGHMATGSVIAGGAGPRQWNPVAGGTAAERSWRFVCGKK
ncbi:MAG: hypothetical protein M0Q22_07950 [Sulfuritalea sp.]|jgi:hypothetical protein|nr:hypothetical protein [Sulfuritalea sp.]